MTSEREGEFGFAAAHDVPIPYLRRIRDYYAALGYGAPYEWAHYAEVPFHPLEKPLSKSRVTIITTAAPYHPRGREPLTMRLPSSTPSTPVTPPRTTTCAFPMLPSTGSTPRPRMPGPTSHCPNCVGGQPQVGSALLPRTFMVPRPTAATV